MCAARPAAGPEQDRDDAARLLALLDGMAMAEPGRMPPERAERILSGVIDGLLGSG